MSAFRLHFYSSAHFYECQEVEVKKFFSKIEVRTIRARYIKKNTVRVKKLSEIEIPGLNKLFKEAREALGLSKSETARRVGVTAAYVRGLEAGREQTITEPRLRKFEEVLRVDFGVVFCCEYSTPDISQRQIRDCTNTIPSTTPVSTSDLTHVHQKKKGKSEVGD
ncbi:MAG: helix-turn-helix transcriptional regulator [Moorea sp. SIO2B7]|nr:helix-turn-helix transcriptional regulator [Moorena sp. SIO2B7]